jgi:hypothetical protein
VSTQLLLFESAIITDVWDFAQCVAGLADDKIVELYENACKVKPDDEDLMSGLFMAYVRVGDYNKQQLVARSLHKLRPAKNPYYFWAVMSIVMQVRCQTNLYHDFI